jgi:hypothetical protein
MKIILSGGPHGGEEHTFASDRPGQALDLPSARAGRVERYELRVAVDPMGEPIDGEFMAIFVGTVRL